MPLPKIDAPLFTLTIPSTGEKKKYRPFTVKEEKVLLIAQESNDVTHIVDSIKQIINNCVFDMDDLNKYAMFDIEWMLMHIRASSVNNEVKFNINDPEFEEQVELVFEIENLKMYEPEGHTKEIEISESQKLMMRYPGVGELEEMIGSLQGKATEEDMLNVMLKSIDSIIVDEDQIYKLSEYSDEEVMTFLNDLTAPTVNQIKNFFETMPRLRHECKYEIQGKEKTFVIEGLETFFI